MPKRNRASQTPLHLMLLPAILLTLVYRYVPMGGIIIAFERFIPARGLFGHQAWIGFGNFTYVFGLPETARILRNTVVIAGLKIVGNLLVPIVTALLLNEVRLAADGAAFLHLDGLSQLLAQGEQVAKAHLLDGLVSIWQVDGAN